MDFDTFSESFGADPIVRIVFWSGAAVLASSMLLLLFVIGLRFRLLSEERRRERFLAIWKPLLTRAASGEEVTALLPAGAIRGADALTLLGAWIYHQESMRGDTRDALNGLARQLSLDSFALKSLQARDVRQRLLALTAIGYLRDARAWDDLCLLATDPHPLVSLAAARAMTLIDPEEAVHLLSVLIATRADWSPVKVGSLLTEVGGDWVAEPLLRAVDDEAPEHIVRVVRYLTAILCRPALPGIRRILAHAEDDEVIAACLRAFAEFADPPDLRSVRQFARHPNWVVRVQVANALGKMGMREDLETLVEMLSDPSWWVRYRAAQALTELPFVSAVGLRQLREAEPDQFAREILGRVMAERQITT